jgi:spore germination cell wall hydrolase CwlJ-like protein
MSRIFRAASAAAVGLTALTVAALTVPGLAQDRPGDVVFESTPVVQSIIPADAAQPVDQSVEIEAESRARHDSLSALVASIGYQAPESEELRCLASGIYHESKGESLEGQLAVAHVILARADSGRFASTNCGVLTQRGQFSFVRGGVVPTPRESAQWRTAVAIARIATEEQWSNPVPGAMFFHATRVSPGWNRPRVARLGNHVFYR